eukprot:gene9479-11154_t
MRNIIVEKVELDAELNVEDMLYVPQFLAPAHRISFWGTSLSKTGRLSEWGLPHILKQLSFFDVGIEDVSALSVCGSLVGLEMIDCLCITDESFEIGIAGCVSLNRCSIQNCDNLSGFAVGALLESCVQLEVVNLSGGLDLELAFARFRSVSNSVKTFTSLDYGGEACLGGAAFQALSHALPNLHTLDLEYEDNIVLDSDLDELVRTCSSLTNLNLWEFSFVSDVTLYSIAQQVPQLQGFHVGRCDVTDIGVIALATAATQLRTLDLYFLPITDDALQTVGRCCRNLRDLCVRYCSLLTDAAFSNINVYNLNTLDVSGTLVTGTFATHIFSKGTALKSFRYWDADHLTSEFVHSLTCKTKLSTLTMEAPQLTESDWISLSTKLPVLCDLSIYNSEAFTDVVTFSFLKNCPELSSPILNGCSVSPKVIELLHR